MTARPSLPMCHVGRMSVALSAECSRYRNDVRASHAAEGATLFRPTQAGGLSLMATKSLRDPNRRPTHPGAILREDVVAHAANARGNWRNVAGTKVSRR